LLGIKACANVKAAATITRTEIAQGNLVLAVASKFGLLDPKRQVSAKGWRKVGTAVVRWPVPIILVTSAIAIVGFVGLLTYVPQYNDQKFTPPGMPANFAMGVADRHFSQARMNPELLMLQADHDLRNPAHMLVIERVAKAVVHMRGIDRVQTITRPLGAPIEHSSIPFLLGAPERWHAAVREVQQRQFCSDARAGRHIVQQRRRDGTHVRHHGRARPDDT